MGFTQEEIDSLLSKGGPSTPQPSGAYSATATLESAPATVAGQLSFASGSNANPSASARPNSAPITAYTAARPGDVARIVHLPVPLKVELASRSMPLSAILHLTEGSIIDFQKGVDEELLLMVANRCVGSGRAVKVGENFGLRITRIGSIRKRIEAMGG